MAARSNTDPQIPEKDRTPDLSDLDDFAAGKDADRKREAEVAEAREDDSVEQETENTFEVAEDLPEENAT